MKFKKLLKCLRSLMHVCVYDEFHNDMVMSDNAIKILKTAPDSVLHAKVIRITEAENDAIHVTVGI